MARSSLSIEVIAKDIPEVKAALERAARIEAAARAVVDSDANHDGLLYVHIDALRAALEAER